MPLVDLRRPAIQRLADPRDKLRVDQHQNDNIARVNEAFAQFEQEFVHGVETLFPNPFGVSSTKHPIALLSGVAEDDDGNALAIASYKISEPRTDGNIGITVEYDLRHTEPYAEYRLNGDQSTTNNIETPVSWGTVVTADAAGVISITSNGGAPLSSRITVSEAGVYDFTGQISWATNATGKRFVFGVANNNGAGATVPIRGYSEVPAVTGDYTALDFSFRWPLSAGGYVEIFALQNSGGALALKGADAAYHPAIQVSRYRNDSTPTGIVRGVLIAGA
jgi:hypothetical protein